MLNTPAPQPIQPVDTGTACLVGPLERGPLSLRLVTSMNEFEAWYGSGRGEGDFSVRLAAAGFFQNGGQRLFVARVESRGAWFAHRQFGRLHIAANGPGLWGERIYVRIHWGSHFTWERPTINLSLRYYATWGDFRRRRPEVEEEYEDLVLQRGEPNFVETMVNPASHLVRVWVHRSAPLSYMLRPMTRFSRLSSFVNPGQPLEAQDFLGSHEPLRQWGMPARLQDPAWGLSAVESNPDIALLAVPHAAYPGFEILNDWVVEQCERLKDRFAILSTGRDQLDPSSLPLPRQTGYAACYFPWIQTTDPRLSSSPFVPAVGHLAGLYARVDAQRGVFAAPANEVIHAALALQSPVDETTYQQLALRGINSLRDFSEQGRGIVAWGARTLSSDPEWKYVNVRRLMIFIEASISRGLQWAVFEPNSEALWSNVRRMIEDFLFDVWRSGGLQGSRPEQAFFVRCDHSTMTQNDLDEGRLICLIGVAPLRPAEFTIVRIHSLTGDAQ